MSLSYNFYPFRIIFIFLNRVFCRSSGASLIQEDSLIFNFSIAGGWYYLALAMSPPSRTEAAVSKKMCRAVILPAAPVAGGQKNAKIYIF
jgi:hypothetical protein